MKQDLTSDKDSGKLWVCKNGRIRKWKKTTKQKITALKKEIDLLTASMYNGDKDNYKPAPNYRELVTKRCDMFGELLRLQKLRKFEKKVDKTIQSYKAV